MKAVLRELDAAGLAYHDYVAPCQKIDFVGLTVDLKALSVRNTTKRGWRLYQALGGLLAAQGATSWALEMIIGHVVHYFALARVSLCSMRRCYDFLDRADLSFLRFSPALVREIELWKGLVFVAGEVELGLPFADTALCSDSSLKGYAVLAAQPQRNELAAAAGFPEKWRFKEVDVGVSYPGGTMRASLARPHAQEALVELPAMTGIVPGGGRRAVGGKFRTETELLEQVGRVPRLSDLWSTESEWRLIVYGAWKYDEAIHVKEARAMLLGLRHTARGVRWHGSRIVSATDSLCAALAAEKQEL